MGIEELLEEKREEILSVASKHGAWFPAGLILDLEELLGQKVDVVTEHPISWLLRRRS